MTRRKGPQMDVNEQLAQIKNRMPQTYQAIQDKAADIGPEAYAMVRRSLKGQPNCFYAVEGGRVVGKPFDMPDVTAQVAQLIVQFGNQCLCMWAVPLKNEGAADGAN